jgi:hypothetical protein
VNEERLRELLAAVADGSTPVEKALAAMKRLPTETLGFATIDHHRTLRQGFPEVIYGAGKTDEQVIALIKKMAKTGHPTLATRVSKKVFTAVKRSIKTAVWHEAARAVTVTPKKAAPKIGSVLVLSAGTSDIPVAEEATVTAEIMGSKVTTVYDVGVAGIHRLFAHHDKMATARVVIVVAGMDGALPSVVGGLVPCPVVAVPTSVGYGASFGGLSALLSMLNACAAGVAVMNIDNGFGAGALAHKINTLPAP